MNENASWAAKKGFHFWVVFPLAAFYVLGIALLKFLGWDRAPILFFPLLIIWLCQILTLGDELDVSGRPSLWIGVLQAIGIGFLGFWITIIWLKFPFIAFLGGLPKGIWGLLLAAAALVGGFIAGYSANRAMSRYQFMAVFTLVAYLGLVPVIVDMLQEFYALERFGKWSEIGAVYLVVIPVWSIAPIAYLIAYYPRYRAYRKTLFEPGYQLHSVRMAADLERFEEVEE